MKKDEGLAAAVFAVVIGGAVAMAIVGDITAPACKAARAALQGAKDFDFGCFEFWMNRYQSTFQTIISAAVGGAGLYFVLKQLRGLAEQNEMTAAALNESRREQSASRRVAIARGISGLSTYTGAATMVLLEATRQHETRSPPKSPKDMGNFGDLAQANVDVYAVLTTPALRRQWQHTRNRFSAAMTFVSLNANEWARSRLTNTTFGEVKMPADLSSAMLEIATVIGEIRWLTQHLEAETPND